MTTEKPKATQAPARPSEPPTPIHVRAKTNCFVDGAYHFAGEEFDLHSGEEAFNPNAMEKVEPKPEKKP